MFKYGLKIKYFRINQLFIKKKKEDRKKEKKEKKERKLITVVCYVCDVVYIVFKNAIRRIADKLFLYSTQLDIDQGVQVLKYEDIA